MPRSWKLPVIAIAAAVVAHIQSAKADLPNGSVREHINADIDGSFLQRPIIGEQWQSEGLKLAESSGSDVGPKNARENVSVIELQTRLLALGFDPGPIDGQWGSKTEEALKSWQSSMGAEPTGVLTPAQRATLIGDENAASATGVDPTPRSQAQSMSGAWIGTYQCGQGKTGLTLTISEGGNFPLSASFKFYPTDENPGVASGEAIYLLTLGTKEGAFNLEPQSWVDQPDGYVLVDAEAALSADGKSLTGRILHPECGELALTHELSELPASEAATPSGDPNPVATEANSRVTGQWYGTLQCSRNVGGEIEFSLAPKSNDQFLLRAQFNTPSSMSNGTDEAVYIGERAETEEISFVVYERVRGDIGFGPDATGRFSFNPSSGEGRFSDGDCSSFSAQKQDGDSLRLRPTASIERGKAAFYAEKNDRKRCEAIVSWTSRLATEYPEKDFYGRDSKWRNIKLFSDDDFVPVFGEAYDFMDYEKRREASKYIRSVCGRDPFVRDRLAIFDAVANRIFDGNPEQQLTSDGYSSSVFAIRSIRAIRHGVRVALEQTHSDQDRSFVDAKTHLLSVRSQVETNADKLWPSEAARLKELIATALSDAAEREGAKLAADIEAAPDGVQGLLLSKSALAGNASDFLSYLSADKRAGVERALQQRQLRWADFVMQPILERTRAATDDLPGAVLITELIANEFKADLLGALQPEYVAKAEAERMKRLQPIIDKRLSALASLPAGRAGLDGGRDWIMQFRTDLSAMSELPIVVEAEKKFLADRSRRLAESVSEFEQARQKNPDISKEGMFKLLNAYLSLPSDRQQPISLEYMFVAEMTAN